MAFQVLRKKNMAMINGRLPPHIPVWCRQTVLDV